MERNQNQSSQSTLPLRLYISSSDVALFSLLYLLSLLYPFSLPIYSWYLRGFLTFRYYDNFDLHSYGQFLNLFTLSPYFNFSLCFIYFFFIFYSLIFLFLFTFIFFLFIYITTYLSNNSSIYLTIYIFLITIFLYIYLFI